MTTQKRLSLHFDIFSEIGRDVEIFAFDDSRLAFFKPTARDRLELQDFLFRLCRFFSRWSFFLYWRWLLVRYTYNRFRLVKDGYWFHRWRRCSFTRRRFLKGSHLRRLENFHRHWFRFDVDLRRNLVGLLPDWRHRGRAALSRLTLLHPPRAN